MSRDAKIDRALRFLAALAEATPERKRLHQQRFSPYARSAPLGRPPEIVAGVDVQHGPDAAACAVAAVFRRGSWEAQEISWAYGAAQEDYAHGMLGFREIPLMLEAVRGLKARPDVFLYDGNGVLHERGFGAASQFGFLLKTPCAGISKNFKGHEARPPFRRGERRPIETESGFRGELIVTRADVKPVCVSAGYGLSQEDAAALALDWSRHRIPEPIRIADQEARRRLLWRPRQDSNLRPPA